MPLVAYVVLLGVAQAPQTREIRGTLNDRLVAEGMMAQIELKPSSDRDLPGLVSGDKVFKVNTPQFRPARGHDGLSVALVERQDEAFLFVDANVDGYLSESERRPYTLGADSLSTREVAFDITLPSGPPTLPFRCRVVTELWEGQTRHSLQFTAAFRAEGYADIGGRRTMVSLPFDVITGAVNTRYGKIGIDANRDGTIDLRGLSGPEVTFVTGDQVIMRVGDRYISVQSADFASRSFVLREHAADEYTVIEVNIGAPLPDFAFTDFDGRARRLSDFKGKYVLLDFWGSWCGPCMADVPWLKAAYERFRDRGLEILGIAFEYTATVESVRALLKEKNIGWPNATSESVKELVEKRFRIRAFPTLILIDPDGVVIETGGAPLRETALIPTLERLVKDGRGK